MRMSRLTVMSCLLLLFLTPAVIGQTAPENAKTASIRKLLGLMEAGATFRSALQIQADQMKKTAKDIPSRFWDELLKEIDTQAFLELVIPIYDKHLSEDDLEALIAFYQTPSGKKLISVLPQIMAETGAAGEKYGAEVSKRVIKKMQADGTFPTAPPAGQAKPPQP